MESSNRAWSRTSACVKSYFPIIIRVSRIPVAKIKKGVYSGGHCVAYCVFRRTLCGMMCVAKDILRYIVYSEGHCAAYCVIEKGLTRQTLWWTGHHIRHSVCCPGKYPTWHAAWRRRALCGILCGMISAWQTIVVAYLSSLQSCGSWRVRIPEENAGLLPTHGCSASGPPSLLR